MDAAYVKAELATVALTTDSPDLTSKLVDRLNELLVEEYVDGGCSPRQAPKVVQGLWGLPDGDPDACYLALQFPGEPCRAAKSIGDLVAMVWGEVPS